MNARIVIVGGGVIGAATAFFLARAGARDVLVLDRDASLQRASSGLSASSIRQQFSQPINIALSQASLAFLRRCDEELRVGGERAAIGLVERGYLYLASDAGVGTLRANHAVQRAHDAPIALLERDALRQRFPWLAVDDLAAGTLGEGGEGWFDGPALWHAFRRAAAAHGARFATGDVQRVERAPLGVRLADGTALAADRVLIAAGAWSAPLAASLDVALPVSARKRDVFVFTSPAQLPGCPLVIDPSGLWFRPEGAGFICGLPPRDGDPDEPPLAPDLDLFDEIAWPALAARVPGFEAVRRTAAWSGYYEMNHFDHNGLVGALPGCPDVFVGCGFSGHGMQQAPAVGRALAELMTGGAYRTLDLTPLAPARIAEGRPLRESNVI